MGSSCHYCKPLGRSCGPLLPPGALHSLLHILAHARTCARMCLHVCACVHMCLHVCTEHALLFMVTPHSPSPQPGNCHLCLLVIHTLGLVKSAAPPMLSTVCSGIGHCPDHVAMWPAGSPVPLELGWGLEGRRPAVEMLIGTITRPRAPGGLWVVVSPQWRAVCLEGGYLQVMGCVVTEQARAFRSCQPRDEAPALMQMVGAMSCLHLSGPQLRGGLHRALQVPSLSCPHENWVYSGMMARGGFALKK